MTEESEISATLLDKVWSGHVIRRLPDGRDVIHIDRHVLHEVTSPIAFEELELAGLPVRNPNLTVAAIDHIVATTPGRTSASYAPGLAFIDALRRNTERHGITRFDLDGPDQGIVHVISPELGLALPGLTVVCGDSHTCTVGGLGALAFGIGSSEIKQVLATQCLALNRRRVPRQAISAGERSASAATSIVHSPAPTALARAVTYGHPSETAECHWLAGPEAPTSDRHHLCATATPLMPAIHLSLDQRLRPEAFLTAMAMAFGWPTSTTSRLPRVTPV